MAKEEKEGRFKIVVRDDEIDCVPHVKRAKQLMWTCDEYDWEVQFDEPAPLVEGSFGGKANQQRGSKIREDAEPRRYKYSVTVFIDGKPHRRDPELIVDE
jgi:hypothetical protein